MSLDRVGSLDLYIGGIFTLRRHDALKSAHVTHVTSALRLPLGQDLSKDYKHLVIEIDDVDDENIIQYFPESNAFIADALMGKGAVLVHCAMGKSRSATLVIAYLLTLPLSHPDFQDPPTPENYLTLLRQSRSIAEPNPGFMSQLQLFASMDCPTELDVHPQYQRWLYQREVELSNACGKAPDRVRFEDEVQRVQEDWEIEGGKVRQLGNKEWRCRKCRRSLLATSEYVIEHEGRTSRRSATHQQPVANGSVCSHVFLAPLSWMKEELDAGKLEGRLECPNAKCHANVGKYAWQGMKCNCGEWVVPGLALAKGKVDEMAARDDSGGHKVGGGMKM